MYRFYSCNNIISIMLDIIAVNYILVIEMKDNRDEDNFEPNK